MENLIENLKKEADQELAKIAKSSIPVIPEYVIKNIDRFQKIQADLKESMFPMLKLLPEFNEKFSGNILPLIQEIEENVRKANEWQKCIVNPTVVSSDPGDMRYLISMPSRDHYLRLELQEIKTMLKDKPLKTKDKNVITLAKNGDLKFKNYCCKMKSSKKRVAILKMLTHQSTATDIITYETKSASNEAVRKAIGKINDMAKDKLKLKYRLIESKGEGYYINKAYKLVKT